MATIHSSLSGAAQCALATNQSITANNEKVLAQIDLAAKQNEASLKMNQSASEATLAQGQKSAQDTFTQAMGLFASAGATVGVGAFSMVKAQTNASAALENAKQNPNNAEYFKTPGSDVKVTATPVGNDAPIKNTDPEAIELDTLDPSGKKVALAAGPATPKAGSFTAQNSDAVTDDKTKAPAPVRHTSVTETEFLNNEKMWDKIGGWSQAAGNLGQAGAGVASSKIKADEAEAQAMATAAAGLSQMAGKAADAATAAQAQAENNKDALIKMIEGMIACNRAG